MNWKLFYKKTRFLNQNTSKMFSVVPTTRNSSTTHRSRRTTREKWTVTWFWSCAVACLTVVVVRSRGILNSLISEIETENARFHAIIQVDISICSFDQNALSGYFFVWTIYVSRKDLISSGSGTFPPSNRHFLRTVFILVLRAGKGSPGNSIHIRVFVIFINYNGTWDNSTKSFVWKTL